MLHKKVIGSDIESIMESLRKLVGIRRTHHLVRTSIVQGFNDSEKVIQDIMDFVEDLENAKCQVFPVRSPEKAPRRDSAPPRHLFCKLEVIAERRMRERYEPYPVPHARKNTWVSPGSILRELAKEISSWFPRMPKLALCLFSVKLSLQIVNIS